MLQHEAADLTLQVAAAAVQRLHVGTTARQHVQYSNHQPREGIIKTRRTHRHGRSRFDRTTQNRCIRTHAYTQGGQRTVLSWQTANVALAAALPCLWPSAALTGNASCATCTSSPVHALHPCPAKGSKLAGTQAHMSRQTYAHFLQQQSTATLPKPHRTCNSSIFRDGSAATAASSAASSPDASSNTSGDGTNSTLRCRLGTTTQHDCQLLLPPPGLLLGVLLLLLLLLAATLPNRYRVSAGQAAGASASVRQDESLFLVAEPLLVVAVLLCSAGCSTSRGRGAQQGALLQNATAATEQCMPSPIQQLRGRCVGAKRQ